MAFGMEMFLVHAGDAAGFLAAMLQGVQSEGDDGRRAVGFGPPDTTDSAFETGAIIIRIAMVIAMDDGIGNLVAHRDSDGPGSNQGAVPRGVCPVWGGGKA